MNEKILIGRQEIADYCRCSTWTVTAMIKAGLKCSGGKTKGSPPRTTTDDVYNFFKYKQDFKASDYHSNKPNVKYL